MVANFTLYICKLASLVGGDPKDPFSIATPPRCRGECYFIAWIAPLYPYLIMLSVKQGGIKYHFWVFGMTRPEIEPRSLRIVANILLIRPICMRNIIFAIYVYVHYTVSTIFIMYNILYIYIYKQSIIQSVYIYMYIYIIFVVDPKRKWNILNE